MPRFKIGTQIRIQVPVKWEEKIVTVESMDEMEVLLLTNSDGFVAHLPTQLIGKHEIMEE